MVSAETSAETPERNNLPPGAAGPGSMLRSAREARDMTQQDVCDSLNLLVRVVNDIETDNYLRLPPATFTRGYLRAYAKLLEIDSQNIVAAFDAAIASNPMPAAPQPLNGMQKHAGGIAELMQKQPGTVLTGAVALVICSVLIVLWAVWPDGNAETVANSLPPFPQGGEAVAAPTADTAATSVAPSDAQTLAATPLPDARQTTAETATEVASPDVRAPGDTISARRITASGEDQLAFAFSDDSWVEVKDRQGRGIYSDLSRAGESLALVGQAPFVIVLGNAPAVTLSFNGERVALSPHTRNNVATLALGQ